MKLTKEFTNLEKSAVKLSVTVDKADVEQAYNSTISKYVKNAQIPGFRKGHVPASVLEKKYGESLKADTIGEIIDTAVSEIFEKETDNRPLPYAQPVLEEMPALDVTKDLKFTLTYDVFPKVSVKDFAGVTVKEPQVTV
ncbi:MAG: trigger factor family protein, partial [Spirochaetia bacterium]|nr:trigger factor family protein [Spirochaetia bacterium]